mmetsp:Transcript_28856/g.66501  ORF Transcript_28856/g.66501 Transcript_28856/m.66501 type:complete len:131 (+) Transcript_28856:63-455(+)
MARSKNSVLPTLLLACVLVQCILSWTWSGSGSEAGFVQSATRVPSMHTQLQAVRKPAVITTEEQLGTAAVDEESQWKTEILRLREASLVECLRASEDEVALEKCQTLSYELARVEAMYNVRHGSDVLKET